DPGVPGQYVCVAHYDGAGWTRLTETAGLESGPSASQCFSDSLPSDQPRVQIVTRRDTSIDAIVFSTDISLEGEAAARYER
ncbi:MAG: hypothetical protein PVF87_07155, partial [Acidimicrobiia bacterium]